MNNPREVTKLSLMYFHDHILGVMKPCTRGKEKVEKNERKKKLLRNGWGRNDRERHDEAIPVAMSRVLHTMFVTLAWISLCYLSFSPSLFIFFLVFLIIMVPCVILIIWPFARSRFPL